MISNLELDVLDVAEEQVVAGGCKAKRKKKKSGKLLKLVNRYKIGIALSVAVCRLANQEVNLWCQLPEKYIT